MLKSMRLQSKGEVTESSLSITITRADGTVEELGVVSYYHRNPLRRALWHLKRKLTHHG